MRNTKENVIDWDDFLLYVRGSVKPRVGGNRRHYNMNELSCKITVIRGRGVKFI